jgi:hypothetical protein
VKTAAKYASWAQCKANSMLWSHQNSGLRRLTRLSRYMYPGGLKDSHYAACCLGGHALWSLGHDLDMDILGGKLDPWTSTRSLWSMTNNQASGLQVSASMPSILHGRHWRKRKAQKIRRLHRRRAQDMKSSCAPPQIVCSIPTSLDLY